MKSQLLIICALAGIGFTVFGSKTAKDNQNSMTLLNVVQEQKKILISELNLNSNKPASSPHEQSSKGDGMKEVQDILALLKLSEESLNEPSEKIKHTLGELVHALETDPNITGVFQKLMSDYPTGSTERNLLINALGSVGSAECQAVLLVTYASTPILEEKQKILNNIGLSGNKLSPESKSFLKNEISNFTDEAIMNVAISVFGRSISKDPDLESIAYLKKELETTSPDQEEDSSKREALLSAMDESPQGIVVMVHGLAPQ